MVAVELEAEPPATRLAARKPVSKAERIVPS